ncbi:MAG TPA: hypothetical protein VGP48_08500 [Stellaceae bacterium]|jgi:hypothetical protein|nr:hypothetical protein [Stellaceae bacterium]
MRGLIRVLLIGAVALGLGGCVAYPAGPYYGGYGYAPAPYYGPPVVGSVFIGGGRFHRDWR